MVDYIERKGIPVCFDAKECTMTFPMQNIHEHVMEFMKEFERQRESAFLFIFPIKIDSII